MPIYDGILQTVISLGLSLKKILHKRHYEKFADGTVKDIEDEIPFDVPEGWAWCQIKNLVKYIGDGDWIESKDQSDKGIRLIQTGNIGLGNFKDKEGKYHFISEQTFNTLQCNEIFEGDILVSRLPEPVGRACVLPKCNYRMITAVDCTILRLNEKIIEKDFFVYYTQSNKYLELIKENCTGTTRLRISRANLEKIYVPIPPKLIQKAIVSDINKYDSTINSIENDRNDITLTINKAKSKILDLAIHGKLVPQDANDEPASVLLEKLRAEKEEKIAKGKLKRDKNDSYIYKGSDNCYYQRFADGSEEQAEITYEIPPNWVWCSLGEISTKLKRGKSPTYTKKSSIMAFAQKCNQKEGPTTLEKALYIDESTLKKYPDEEKMQFNDIVINSTGTGTLGRVGVFNCKVPDDVVAVYPDSHVSSVRINSLLYAKYFYYFVKNKQSYLEEMGEGSTNQKELKIDTIANLIVPLPPLDEQKRIVEKIENAFAKLDSIAKQLE